MKYKINVLSYGSCNDLKYRPRKISVLLELLYLAMVIPETMINKINKVGKCSKHRKLISVYHLHYK